MSVGIRFVGPDDALAWASLYAGYRTFYQLPDDPEVVKRTWDWLLNGEHSLVGLVATNHADVPIGLANLRWFARPSTATRGLYVDDLFTSPEARHQGVAQALLHRAAELAGEGGASVVRWITAEGNADARRLYDRVAVATPWVTYDLKPAPAASTPS
ncbi:GNAT family N-acetyltransferase [Microbacterium betulae]|uniref:GNAT family N-acetyltransferase n=1 Tax=Microbacterium betulae TaxID=2981139 RepID=A0AA97FH95_9MICO|nr:GNAT family N-acetyltransferase [Microbacterium sp. AB]WOF21487.1 GNAT family N-acetyltransferase [Microbacterium sp. AB]